MNERLIAATYRLQFNADFTFSKAETLIPYLVGLGISHLYASPIFTARKGSAHGYDGIDATTINPELGGEQGFHSLVTTAHRAGLGLILDIVPNHMAADIANPPWAETLMLGAPAPAAKLFDIDWRQGKIFLPVLRDELHVVVERGELELQLDRERGVLVAAYFDKRFPLRPRSIASVVQKTLPNLAAAWAKLETSRDRASMAFAREGLRQLDDKSAATLTNALAELSIATILHDQHWQLTHWRTATDTLSYRRFFNITDLVGVRVEDPWVFEHIHRAALDLVASGALDGLRIDHIDGLADPEAYLEKLRQEIGPTPLLLVEKILEGHERLRDWPIDGSTGYDRLNDINGLFVDPAGYDRLDNHLKTKGLLQGSAEERLVRTKHEVVESTFGSEISQLTHLAQKAYRNFADETEFSTANLRTALVAIVSCCPVYRTYATARGCSDKDKAIECETLALVARLYGSTTHRVAEVILQAVRDAKDSSGLELQIRLQQLTGPAMAKGLEDTEFYRSIALLSVNEVGGDLSHPARSVAEFHARNQDAAQRRDLVPLSTHDTKRGADARAKLNLLSHHAEQWIDTVEHWSRLTQLFHKEAAPDELDRELIFQTLVAAWPISADRLKAYVIKALREAKRHSRWDTPNEAYEQSSLRFAESLVQNPDGAPFRKALEVYLALLKLPARLSGIAQTILQLTVPGIPDIYRGTEFWDFNLVDPDNRQPVAWDERRHALARPPPELLDDDTGIVKLHLIRELLSLRRRHADVFSQNAIYRSLDFPDDPPHFVGFERLSSKTSLLVIVPTRLLDLPDRMSIKSVPQRAWTSGFSTRPLKFARNGDAVLSGLWPFVVATARV